MKRALTKILFASILIGFFCSHSFAGNLDMFYVSDTIPIKNVNKNKLYKAAVEWMQDKDRVKKIKLLRSNPEDFVIEGKGFLNYYNHVNLGDVFLSPRAGERTNGTIVYEVKVQILDSIVIVVYSNFSHDAYFSEFGKISLGLLYKYESVPPGKCSENKLWCNAVWKEMKTRAIAEVSNNSTTLVPDEMIRKKGKVFKVEKEETKAVQKKEDPEDYLKLDSYLNQEEVDTTKAMIIK